ncbi:Fas apoptotic inhibitory molecule [Ancylostoma ceylanicum]|uniref:Fas apoptotic inhibitory molecule n=1 Tax=Ancylostoma ceylanicum TaxID=53326 RepID=A0A0D6L892_9BILA|nr:Fas apoptotic inhibitory molecule [Ancylostoma ceylanicum]
MVEGDIVAKWTVPLQDKVYRIEFEHGTTTGKRVIRVDGKEILRRDWMFKLVGKEPFQLGKMKCLITVEALGTFAYEYSLEVNGKNYEKFREEQSKKLLCWETRIGVRSVCNERKGKDFGELERKRTDSDQQYTP